MKVRGWICRAAALGCVDATLTLPLSLGNGEAISMLAPCHSYTKNHSRISEISE